MKNRNKIVNGRRRVNNEDKQKQKGVEYQIKESKIESKKKKGKK